MRAILRSSLLAFAAIAAMASSALADPVLDALVAAYPDAIAGYDAKDLIMKNGSHIPLSNGIANKTPEQRVTNADITDMFAMPYTLGANYPIPRTPADDPGRARSQALFDALYGDCTKGQVKTKTIQWLPSLKGGTLKVATANGVAEHLEAVSRDLEALPARFQVYLKPSAGTYNCRAIAGTMRMSMHAYAAAIDINVKYTDYWRWSGAKKETDKVTYRNKIPMEIVEVFEKHGFIWGGKWYHYDTMHFEYRPEIIALAKKS
ncbi:M15 family metallopeptidase [Labrys okinawensis]|uniref:M15 family metallopeptidase n=1 Tax=Labrys okinawensis TaxID=346911 RepID=UPI0039BCAFAE